MRNWQRFFAWSGIVLFAVIAGLWLTYTSIYLRHLYPLLDCSKGKVALIPRPVCQAYLFHFRGTPDDISTISQDGSLIAILSTASQPDRLAILDFLIKRGLNINGLDRRFGTTALHMAVLDNDLEITRLLLQHGANPAATDESGKTPLQSAMERKGSQNQPDRIAVIQLLQRAPTQQNQH